ncbi:MAG TPA: histidine kinase [Chitinophaga sp.]|uniref:sensor histidine kinase n=1 Tax=Chitinophaga sp. TaxID=1869181 RepID=UPI002BBBCE9B|nr:histidine kinase [Chitinophaga sp.]HVI45785.1 histidine kinase [Chitinophaga sp.]
MPVGERTLNITSGTVTTQYNWRFKLTASVIIAACLVLSLIFINPFSELDNIISTYFGLDLLFDISWFSIMGWSIMECSLLISGIMEKYIPWEKDARKRFILQLIIQSISIVTMLLLLITLTNIFLSLAVHEQLVDNDDLEGFRQIIFISIGMSLVVTGIHSGGYLINKWKASILETSTLKQVVLESQLQSLKLQLDPHFLFNNFSTLSSLISEDPGKAQEFLESLSQVHRYMLFNLNKNIVPLTSELEFIDAYIYLIRIRFGNNVDISINGACHPTHPGIPPIALQILIENAVKHNIASKTHPLKITILLEEEFVTVSNNVRKIPSIVHSSKVGLKNIMDRYLLLSDKTPVITATGQEFTVKLPLLDINRQVYENIDH